MSNVTLDIRQRDGVFLAAETDRVALGAGARGAAYAVHVVFRIVRQIEIEHMADVGNVQTARSHVGGDQHCNIAVVKVAHHFQPLGLRYVARQGLRHEAVGGQRPLEHFGDTLGVDEHHGAACVDPAQQPHQQRDLLVGRRKIEHLRHPVDGHLVRLDADQLGIVHVLVGQLHDPMRQGGGKHHGQPQRRVRQTPQNEADVLDESQIEHAVGFIHDRHLNMAQIEHMLLEIVDDAAGSADHYIDAFLENAPLLFVVHAAEHDGELQAGVLAQAQGVGVDLHRELARRCDDDGARRILRPVGRAGIRQQAIEKCDEEGRGLAGTGLGLTRHVAAGEGHGQGLRLNGGTAAIAQFGNAPLQGFGDVEGFERELTEMGV